MMRFGNAALKAVLFCMTFGSIAAHGDISRNCSASLYVAVLNEGPLQMEFLATILGKGSCNNVLQANLCRERARHEIDVCLNDAWASRQQNVIPARCKTYSSGSSRSGAKLEYDGILGIAEPNRLTARAAHRICCIERPNAGQVQLNFAGTISGDQKCAQHKIGNNLYQEEFSLGNYNMNCNAWRDAGICD